MASWFIIIHILGAVQGVFLAAVLVSERRGSIANNILAVTMLIFALDLATAVYHATGYDEVFPHLIGIDYALAFLYGPLLYLYTRALSGAERIFRKSWLWHFLPFALLVLFLVPFYLQTGTEKLAFVRNPEPDLRTRALGVVNHLKLVHALIYVGIILGLLTRHRRRIRESFSSTERINLVWLRNLMMGIIAMTGLAAVLYLLSLRDQAPVLGLDPATAYDDYTLIGLVLFVYAIGYMGLRQPEVFGVNGLHVPEPTSNLDVGRDRFREPTNRSATASGRAAQQRDDKPQYAKSGMDPETARLYKQQLQELMETEKLYRRGDLSLQDLSDALEISPHNLTEVINTQLGLNFYDFVNGYRVREVQERLADPTCEHLTLLAIGLDAGFNSKASFNAVFKKHTKMTPSQFKAQAGKAVSS